MGKKKNAKDGSKIKNNLQAVAFDGAGKRKALLLRLHVRIDFF